MTARRLLIALWAAPVLFVAGPMIVAACTGGASTPGPCQNGSIVLGDCEPDPTTGVVSDRFTDEACDSLDTAETRAAPVASDMQAPAVDAPTEAQALPAAMPFTFRWHAQGLALRAPARRPFRWQDDLARWTTLLPAAEAHCSPFGGVAFALIFRAGNQQVLRVETANTSWTPDRTAWGRLQDAHGTISLTMEATRFSDNTVSEGPFVTATPRTFTLTP